MKQEREYFEAYDDRYTQVHARGLRWSGDQPTPIVHEILEAFGIPKGGTLLELGCGEGRDAAWLLGRGFRVLATDISREAVDFCRRNDPEHRDSYRVLDCVNGQLEGEFSFIYAVAVVHMLVEDDHRQAFYRFIRSHLSKDGIALVCTMGDGERHMESDTAQAFTLQSRVHQESGQILQIAGTSCRVVDFPTFRRELAEAGFSVLREGITCAEPDFDSLMYAVIK